MQLLITHYFADGLYSKETRVPSGHVLVQHKHKFSHLSILASGSVELMADGESQTINAPACLDIKAGVHHGIRALTDVVWYCIHSVTDEKLEDIDELLIVPAVSGDMEAIAGALAHE
jgi:quercetin dioxygenase-like cupin family protein